MAQNRKGRLIVLDGADGCGKSTQFEMLLNEMQKCPFPVRGISYPDYKNPSSALVRMYLRGDFSKTPGGVNAYAASSFYAVDRYAAYMQFWRGAYENGAWILASRYTTSNAIHQMGKLPSTEWDAFLGWLEDFEYDRLGLPRPDLVFYLSVPFEISQKLLLQRYGGDKAKEDIHESDSAYLKRCREAAEYAAKKMGWVVVLCTENEALLAADVIHKRLLSEIGERLGVGWTTMHGAP